MIDINKKYRTRIGDNVTLPEIDPRGGSVFSATGPVDQKKYDFKIPTSWRIEGDAWYPPQDEFDRNHIEAKEEL